ncbi:MAG: hypothetical protein AB1641_00640 [Thermodesulfobacteriota bacterium]
MRKTAVLLGLLAGLMLAAGCAETGPRLEGKRYGTVPPALPRGEAPPEKSQWPADDEGRSQEELAARTIASFREAYLAAGKPRLAVFLNRQLSDEVQEWVAEIREVTAAKKSSWFGEKRDESKSETVAYTQKYQGVGGQRPAPEEVWVWAFEDGFLEPFLAAGTLVVDRATIMRQAAAKPGQTETLGPDVSVKGLEMEALRGGADLFVEMLVTRSPSSALGYEFKAAAKEVKTGFIRANVTSLRWTLKKKREAVVTAKGYELKDKETDLPSVRQVSTKLAVEMMNSLMRAWGKGEIAPAKPVIKEEALPETAPETGPKSGG